MIHDLMPDREVVFYISLLDRISPLLDCADAIEIDVLNRLDYFTPKQIDRGRGIVAKYLTLLDYWQRSGVGSLR